RHLFPRGEDFLLLPPTRQPQAYANVDRMFATRAISRGAHVLPLPYGPELIPGDVAAHVERTNIAGLLVLHRGEIRLEHYALGLTEATRWSTMSTVKSMTSTLVGAALRDGSLGSLDDEVAHYLPALRGSAYDGVSVRHLLTMSSGTAWDETYTDRGSHVNRYSKALGDRQPGGVIALLRSLGRAAPPGRRFNYNTGDTYLLGCLLTTATGRPLAEYMTERIWSRWGMECDAYYTLDQEGGQEIGGSRAGVALRDFGRFGQFILSGGGDILPAGWVEEAARPAFALDPAANSYGATHYGYSWWLDPDGAMVAVGFAGQSLYVNRAAELVIVTLSCWPQPPHVTDAVDRKAERLAFRAAVLAAVQ
ncbi:MAG: class A beta-lactamase-related serine hydrolase, partial [Acetobacteraceae bacterium]